jgi:prepilin-type N-terminal cleavage/methylation domain-containing protein
MRTSKGFTLIEVMVSIALSMLLITFSFKFILGIRMIAERVNHERSIQECFIQNSQIIDRDIVEGRLKKDISYSYSLGKIKRVEAGYSRYITSDLEIDRFVLARKDRNIVQYTLGKNARLVTFEVYEGRGE